VLAEVRVVRKTSRTFGISAVPVARVVHVMDGDVGYFTLDDATVPAVETLVIGRVFSGNEANEARGDLER